MIFESGRFKGIFNIDASKNRVNLSKKNNRNQYILSLVINNAK